MPEKTQLFISTPCHEQWSHMQPNTDGRFCGSCQHTVVDFTMMSDQEILAWLSRSGKSFCGRFMEGQLNRKLSTGRPAKKNRWAVWNFLLAGLLVSSEASAQKKMQWNFWDTAARKPIPGVTVQVNDGSHYLVADSTGKVRISHKTIVRGARLKVSSIGYSPITVVVDESWIDKGEKTIEMVPLPVELPAVSIVGYGIIRCKHITGSVTTVRDSVSLQQMVKDTLAYFGLLKKPFTVYPNPVARGGAVTLSVQTGVAGDYVVQLFTGSGALVESMRIEGVDGKRTELLNIPGTTAAGLYFVRLFHAETGKLYTEKLVVL